MAAEQSPPDAPYWLRLQDSCYPLSVTHFRAIKAAFYTAVVAAVMLLTFRETAIDPKFGFGLFVFAAIVFITEVKEIELAFGAGSLSATFNGDHEDEADD